MADGSAAYLGTVFGTFINNNHHNSLDPATRKKTTNKYPELSIAEAVQTLSIGGAGSLLLFQ